MKVEDAVLVPHGKRGSPKESTVVLRALKVGDVKRIEHPDVACATVLYGTRIGQGSCSLAQEISRLRKKGWELDYYHEQQYVLVVRRVK